MELEELKSEYQNSNSEHLKSINSLNKMKQSNQHPVLKSIKRQLIIESVLWGLLLIVFYDFFDGHLKALFWNVLLAISILLLLTHNVLGYSIVKTQNHSINVLNSLKKYLYRIRTYAKISIVSRGFAVAVFMGFLSSTAVWDKRKIMFVIISFLLLIVAQVYTLNLVWNKRIKKIKNQIEVLEK